MDEAGAQRLSELTTQFYQQVGASFSATRQAAWPGWERVAGLVEALVPRGPKHLRLADVACGNLRFERFLAATFPQMEAWAVDNCAPMVGTAPPHVRLRQADLARMLLGTGTLGNLDIPRCDLTVSFGFMHHLPLRTQRERLLDLLVERARPGGLAVVSLWQFAKSERLLAKAREATARGMVELGLAELGRHDYLMGWQGRTDVYRFCHHVSEEEVDLLAAHVAGQADELARFSADGRDGDLNRYLVLRRKDLAVGHGLALAHQAGEVGGEGVERGVDGGVAD